MTILHVSTPTSWRGGEQQAAYLAIALKASGIDQIVLCPDRSVLATRMQEAGIPVETFASRGLLNLNLAQHIAKLCRKKNIDIIHCHDSHAHSAAVISASVFNNPTPIVVSRRVDFPVSGNFMSRWKYNHPSVRRILCVSEMIRTITAPAIKDASKLTVVYSGIDLSRYDLPSVERKLIGELNLSPSVRLVGNISALADHKDYPTFLQTAAAICKEHDNIHFIIAGKGPEEEKIKSIIRDQNLGDKVHLLGFRDDVVQVMQSLDVFLMTSITEGLGTIVLDAFAAGVPVVATCAGGIPEMVVDGVTGLLADPRDVVALKDATLRILNDPALTKQLTDNANERVKDFSFQATAEKTLKIYRAETQRLS
ncbi:MAG: glycosyltransferase family 4 protein [Saprospiraceae bacterium]|nr:glycosyltransferase family 4 protein [Saprospiraceae bacterium]